VRRIGVNISSIGGSSYAPSDIAHRL